MDSRRAALAIAFALAASAAIAWILLRSPSAPEAAKSSERAEAASTGQSEALTHASLESERIAAVEPASSDAPAAGASPTEVTTPPEEPALSIWGMVRDAETGEGLAACTVRLASAKASLTDAAGRFTVKLDPRTNLGASLSAVYVERSGESLFHGSVLLQDGMEILVQSPVVLRGRCVQPEGRPLHVRGVTAYLEPTGLREIEFFLASTNAASEDGRFEIHARPPDEAVHNLVLSVGLGVTSLRAVVPWAELRSEAGATIVLDVCPLRLTVVASDGAPIAKGELRLAAWVGSAQEPAVHVATSLEGSAPLELALPGRASGVELVIGSEGYAPFVAQRDAAPCGESWAVELVRLGPDDVIDGRVLDANGQPVEAAFASCCPLARDPEVGVAANVGVRTDAEGRFSLPYPAGKLAALRAFHVDHGMLPDQEVRGGARDVVLRFLGVQDVEVDARFPAGAHVAAGAHPFEWVLALQDGATLTGSERTDPFTIEEAPPGDHRLYVVAVGGTWYASEVVSVFPALDARVEIELEPARHVRGHVLDAEGKPAAGIVIRVVVPAWPEELASKWGSGSTDQEGAFELLAGNAAECALAFERDGVELLRTGVATEIPLEIRLP
jgi:hypothetical protein